MDDEVFHCQQVALQNRELKTLLTADEEHCSMLSTETEGMARRTEPWKPKTAPEWKKLMLPHMSSVSGADLTAMANCKDAAVH
jgi:hypothetical protein